ncbi:5'-3' exonuclease [Lyticum sinuosum]|uniref:PolA domain 5'-3' exonuclease n=1 Tax=Lyticum sinuosum TaxID=1332059 RepID=A0AAE4VKL4_9RICK|nr:5'-3' exonuclease H3TH domain-containing protein [Lyticum sinuosum]MDZ5761108.1 PolA domain 5'-3' exonuclease [Lyticum sinuosum]
MENSIINSTINDINHQINKKLFIIDTSALIFRSHYAYPTLINKNGMAIGATYGFIHNIIRFLSSFDINQTNYIVMALDIGGKKTIRHEMFSEYKANRQPCPNEIINQFPGIISIINAFGIAMVKNEKYEADDCIATCANIAKKNKIETFVVSGDKDLLQLVNETVKCFDPFKDIIIDQEGVMKKFGIKPSQLADYLALMGDATDNIPGAKGIGPKNAQKLLEKYLSVKEIYDNIDNITPIRIRELLEKSKKNVDLSYKLSSLYYNVDIENSLDDWLWCGFPNNGNDLIEIFKFHGFKQINKRIDNLIKKFNKFSTNI